MKFYFTNLKKTEHTSKLNEITNITVNIFYTNKLVNYKELVHIKLNFSLYSLTVIFE